MRLAILVFGLRVLSKAAAEPNRKDASTLSDAKFEPIVQGEPEPPRQLQKLSKRVEVRRGLTITGPKLEHYRSAQILGEDQFVGEGELVPRHEHHLFQRMHALRGRQRAARFSQTHRPWWHYSNDRWQQEAHDARIRLSVIAEQDPLAEAALEQVGLHRQPDE